MKSMDLNPQICFLKFEDLDATIVHIIPGDDLLAYTNAPVNQFFLNIILSLIRDLLPNSSILTEQWALRMLSKNDRIITLIIPFFEG
jgi:hypothetical protein